MTPGAAGRWAVLAAAALAIAPGCTARDTVATSGERGDDLTGYCAGDGPPVLVDRTCAGELAQTLFSHAVCGCADLVFGGDLLTDGFDSRDGPYAPDQPGGDVASNVGLDASLAMTINGNLTVGSDGVEAGSILTVDGDLACGGPLGRPGSAIEVGGGAQIAADVVVDSLSVGGTLVTRPGATVMGEITAGARESAEVVVPPPCRCDDDDQADEQEEDDGIDVARLIANHEFANDNDEIELEAGALVGVEGDAEVELPCGLFYLEEILGTSNGTVTLAVSGRTALFVGGNITLQQGLAIELGEDAELDMFIDGNINVSGVAALGDPTRPRSLRLYVASGGSIALSAGSLLAGNLYAPRADLASSAPLEVFGSLVVNRVNGAASVTVHRDLAVAEAADSCVE